MDKKFYINNRTKLLDKIEDSSVTILFSGHDYQKSADQYFPFSVNRNFYYLTGINQANVILVLVKGLNGVKEYLLIEENDEVMSKWVGMKLTKEEAKNISGIENILYLNSFDSLIFSLFNSSRKSFEGIKNLYLDLERNNDENYSNKALRYSKVFKEKYPEVLIKNAYTTLISLRMIKTDEEIEKIKESIATTKGALENVMKNIKP